VVLAQVAADLGLQLLGGCPQQPPDDARGVLGGHGVVEKRGGKDPFDPDEPGPGVGRADAVNTPDRSGRSDLRVRAITPDLPLLSTGQHNYIVVS
jgi:hypothetical protein